MAGKVRVNLIMEEQGFSLKDRIATYGTTDISEQRNEVPSIRSMLLRDSDASERQSGSRRMDKWRGGRPVGRA